MKLLKKVIVVSSLTAVITACGTTATKDTAVAAAPTTPPSPYPDWYFSPSDALPNGLATASCAAIPGNKTDIARKKAQTSGYADLARQVETRVKAMAKQYSSVTTTNEGDAVDETFEDVTKQIANQSLSGARPIKSQIVTEGGTRYFCTLFGLDPQQTGAMLDKMLNRTKGISSDQESVLRARFLAAKAQKELEKSLK